MGVNGLTSFLRQHKAAIAKNIELRKSTGAGNAASHEPLDDVHIVLDGWSFIYIAYQSSRLPWVYGGEYDQFSAILQQIVEAWICLGIHLSVVFDGPEQLVKFPTCISRLNSNQVHHAELFFRTSQATRVTSRFLGETRIIPPLVYTTCVETLLKLSSQHRAIDVYFADGEADPFAVELAGRLGAYVAGVDSDFVILNSGSYKGYIPLDELEWVNEAAAPPEHARTRTLSVASSILSLSISDIGSDSSLLDDLEAIAEDGFVPVRKKRARSTSAKRVPSTNQAVTHRSLVPPEEFTAVVFPVYTPQRVAEVLGIPMALLPLLGAIVGNDFTLALKNPSQRPSSKTILPGYTHQKLLFDHKLNATQRVEHAANVLSAQLRADDKKKKKTRAKQRSVLEIIRSTVTHMITRLDQRTDKEIDSIVNGIVESALQYAIPPSPLTTQGKASLWPTPFCALHHDAEDCHLEVFIPEEKDEEEQLPLGQDSVQMVQNLYLRAYREGSLDPMILDILVTGTMWPRLFLENPDYSSASGPLEASAHLRQWLYAILDQGIGVYIPPPMEEEEEEGEPSGDKLGRPNGIQHSHDSNVSDEYEEEEDEDEVIDVVDDEDDEDEPEDPLAALKGALQRLKGAGGAGGSGGLPTIPDQEYESENASAVDPEEEETPCVVTEYVRKGGRIVDHPVLVPELHELLEAAVAHDENLRPPRTSAHHPIQLASISERVTVLLIACGSNTSRMRTLPREWLLPVLATRCLVRHAAEKEKEKAKGTFVANPMLKRWSRGEVAALLHAFQPGEENDDRAPVSPSEGGIPALSERSIQLMARALSVVEGVTLLIQALNVSSAAPVNTAEFKGRVFHERCKASSTGAVDYHQQIPPAVFEAVLEGMEEAVREDKILKVKKPKRSAALPAKPIQKAVSFNILASLDASA